MSSCAAADEPSLSSSAACPDNTASSDDDWEAIADRPSDEVLIPVLDSTIEKLTLEDTKTPTPKRRGRGSFLYKENGLYSDRESSGTAIEGSDDDVLHPDSAEAPGIRKCKYGTSHVLVLTDIPPSTRTTNLERLFQKFKDQEVSIRWVNDTVALAVFRTPSIAREALSSIDFPFIVHVLSEEDSIMKSVRQTDLEPPCSRPKTSATTAHRLIAHGMGVKLPTSASRSSDFKKQEEARKQRIASRQISRDDAWGTDETL